MVKTKLFPSFWMAVLLVLACIAAELTVGVLLGAMCLLASWLFGLSPHAFNILTKACEALTALTVFGVVILLHSLLAKPPLRRYLSLSQLTPRRLAAMAVMVPGLAILLSEADNLTRWILPMPAFLARIFESLFNTPALSLLLLVVVAPLTEEFVFRGIILRGLLSRYSMRTAVLLSALIFACGHLNPYQFLSALILGLVAGWVFAATESLSLCMVIHALNNFLAWFVGCGLLGIEISGLTFTSFDDVSFQPWWLDLAGLCLAVFGLFLLTSTIREAFADRCPQL